MFVILCQYICIVLFVVDRYSNGIVVFQPAFIVTKEQTVTAFLLGNSSHLSLTLSTVQPSNTTGRLPLTNCAEDEPGQWTITREALRTNIVKVQLSLNRSLQLCANGTDCCPEPLCVLETLRIQACHGDLHQATLLVQAEIYAQVFPTGPVSDNRTVIPNQAYQPLGRCACDLTIGTCDVLCCCDRDCSPDVKLLFESQCFPGVFGGNVTPIADYNCSVQLSKNSPDWFPFLCVTSPSNNSPFLGLFYQGKTILPKRSPSFQAPVLITPVPVGAYRQGDPILTESDKYFTIPQQSLVGQCVDNAPVAFLQNFRTWCPFRLLSCPTRPPLLTNPSELKLRVRDGLGGVVTVSVKDEVVTSLSPFVSSPAQAKQANPSESSLLPRLTQASDPLPANLQKLCENVTLALDYLFFWKANGLTSIALTRTIGNVALDPNVFLTVRFSAVFVNGNASVQPNSGNPGYLIGKSVIGGSVGTLDNGIDYIQRASISLWQPVGEGLCSSASTKAVQFGENATAGCLLYLSVQNLTQCNQLRETTRRTLAVLLTATHVARNGNPDYSNVTEWVNITYVPLNVSSQTVNMPGSCENIPSHLNINIRTTRADLGGGQPQRLIQAVEVSYILSTWRVQCGGGDPVPCLNPAVTQPFPISSAVTFSDIPVQTGPPKTRFQINFTEFDCDRNDVCWPQLAYPLTRYYTGEPYSQSLAKGLILVFFFIAASVLGTPWRQIRQAWG